MTILQKVKRLLEIQKELQTLYQESDKLQETIAKHHNFPEYEEVDYNDFHVVLEDRFRNGNMAWQSVPVRRYTVKVKENA